MKKLILLILTLFFATANALAVEYVTTHNHTDADWVLSIPFIYKGEVYLDYSKAIFIENVVCDGVEVKSHQPDAVSHRKDATMSINGGIIYTCVYYGFFSMKYENGEFKDNEFIFFDIPKNAKEIIITYRVRTPDGKISDKFKLRSFSVQSLFGRGA